MALLLIEDNALDAERIQRTLNRLEVRMTVHRAKDGVEALDMLYGRDGCEAIDPPRVVFVDLNMPRMSGGEFIRAFRSDRSWFDTPIYVLTTSDRHRDMRDSMDSGASGYILKPLGASDLMRVFEEIGESAAPVIAASV